VNKIKVSEVRAKFPMYGDMSDDQLLIAIRNKYYQDIPLASFVKSIDYDTDREKYSPAKDSFFGNLPAAYGGGVASIARALGAQPLLNKVGLDALPQSKDEAAQLDESLNNAPGGTTGRVLGAMSVLAPSAAIPGANTLAGSAAIGGGVGVATTEGGLLDRLKGGMWGAGGGVAGNLLGRGISAGVGGVKGLVEPFTQAGRERIAGRTLERFATNPNAIATAPTGPSITGAMPTLAEATKDTGLATLERAIATMSPEAAEQLLARAQANNAARINALQQVAGNAPVKSSVKKLGQIASGQSLASATGTRSAAANASYGAARKAGVDDAMSDALRPQIESLLQRPSVKAAIADAKKLAGEEGIELTDLGNAQGLQYVKQSLDDMIGALGPKEKNKIRLLTQTSNDLKAVLDQVAPKLRQADAEFMFNSVPVNRAQVGKRLAESTSSAIRDLSENRPLQAHAFSRALNDEEQLIKQATGFKGSSLDDFMTPSQMQRINAVRGELETASNLSRAANGAGSQTAKMLASQNLVRRVAGPLGLPESWIESTISKEMMRAPQFLAKSAEEQIQASVIGGLLSPFEGQRLLTIAQKANPTKSEAALLTKALGSGLLGYSAAQYATQ
jgi:hypothetical protein